jgi:Chaperone of endosialidase
MKRCLILAASVLTLTGAWEPAAADEDVRKRAAPRRAAAPAREAVRPAPRPEPARAANWTGSQVGGHGGGNSGAGTFTDPIVAPFITPVTIAGVTYVLSPGIVNQGPPFSFAYNDTSFAGGLFYNYSVQTGMWVWRVEVDVTGQNTESSAAQTTFLNAPYGTVTAAGFTPFVSALQTTSLAGSLKQGWDGTLRGTIGGLFFDQYNMLFVTGGLAVGHWRADYAARVTTVYCNHLVTTGGCGSVAFTDTLAGAVSWDEIRVGAVVGAGWEGKFNGFNVAVEYLYKHYGKEDLTAGLARTCVAGTQACPTAAGSSAPLSFTMASNTIRARVGVPLEYLFSDIRLKRDIAPLSRLDNGIQLYRYRYLWSDEVYVGVMAQEVLEIVPSAVVAGFDGFLRVDYGQLGTRMMTWDEWTRSPKSRLASTAH